MTLRQRAAGRVMVFFVLFHLPFFVFSVPLFSRPQLLTIDSPAPAAIPPDSVLTFVTCPKPQTIPDQINIAKIVLTVWLSYPFTRVLLLSNRSEYDPTDSLVPYIHAKFGPSRLSFGGNLSLGFDDRPLIRDWFTEGFRLVKSGYLCFANGDIIVTPLWMNAAIATFEAFGPSDFSQTMIYGTRTDVRRRSGVFDISLDKPEFVSELTDWLGKNVRCNNPHGLDVVLVHSTFNALNWSEIPDFVVGMCVWDNFFMAYANMRARTVTMDFGPKVFHVDHPRNACNFTNSNYFRSMAYGSRYFSGFDEHWAAKWTMLIHENRLRETMGSEFLNLKRRINDSIPQMFE
jgi:hypothetical protein